MTRTTTGRELTNDQRQVIYLNLLQQYSHERLPIRCMPNLARQFQTTRKTIQGIWTRGQESMAATGVADVRSRKKGHCGRPLKFTVEEIEARIKAVPPFARTTYTSLAHATGISAATLCRLVKAKKIRRRTSRLKPLLTDKHKEDRLSFVRSF
ncbi:hypothetical protein As57867_002865, partial [Aphanomyces stellatus]